YEHRAAPRRRARSVESRPPISTWARASSAHGLSAWRPPRVAKQPRRGAASGAGQHRAMGGPPRAVGGGVSRRWWLGEITVRDQGGLLDAATMEQTWSRVLAQRPTKIVVIDMTDVGFLDEALARWLIDSQRRAASMDVELVVLAPRGQAREKLRRHAVGS